MAHALRTRHPIQKSLGVVVLCVALLAALAESCSKPISISSDLCADNQYRCEDDVLRRCNVTRSGYDTVKTCAPGSCSEQKGVCDAPLDAQVRDVVPQEDAPVDSAAPDVDSSPPVLPFEVLLDGIRPQYVALSTTHLYFTAAHFLRRCERTSCKATVETLAQSADFISCLAFADGRLYFCDEYRRIQVCRDLSPLPCVPSTFAQGYDVGSLVGAVHRYGTRAYWLESSFATQRIMTCPLSGCTSGYPRAVYTSVPGDVIHGEVLTSLVRDASNVYILRYFGGLVRFSLINDELILPSSGIVLSGTGIEPVGLNYSQGKLWWSTAHTLYSCATPECQSPNSPLAGRYLARDLRFEPPYIFGSDEGVMFDGGLLENSGSLWRAPIP